jgi:pimeloyl-ACP methyl ester carboxylesterase
VPEIVEELIDVEGKKVDLRRSGAGDTFFFLHSSIGEYWMPEFLNTLRSRMEVICPAQPGFGESSGLEEIDDMDDLAFHYSDLIRAVGGERVHIAGSSIGGWLAAEIAVRWPERLRSLVLIDPVGIWIDDYPIAPIWGVERDELATLMFSNQDHPIAEMIRSIDLDNPPPEEVLLPFIMSQTATAKVGWDPYLHNPKLSRRLHRISCPTLIVWGDLDRVVPIEYGKRYAELIPGADFRTVSAGHMAALENPDEVSGLIDEFLFSQTS